MRPVQFSRDEAEAVYDCVKHSVYDGQSQSAVDAANRLAEAFGFGVRLVVISMDQLIAEVSA